MKPKKINSIGEPVMVRVQPPLLDLLDKWRRDQADLPTRGEAFRRLAETVLKSRKTPTKD